MDYLDHGGKLVSIRRNLSQQLQHKQSHVTTDLQLSKWQISPNHTKQFKTRFKADLINQFSRVLYPRSLVIVQNTAGAVQEYKTVNTRTRSYTWTRFCCPRTRRNASPFELDLTLQVLEENEVLKQNVPPEIAVAELQIHQLRRQRTAMFVHVYVFFPFYYDWNKSKTLKGKLQLWHGVKRMN